MSKGAAIIDEDLFSVKCYFTTHGLPWDPEIELTLHNDGVKFVEHLKIYPDSKWKALFEKETMITQAQADIVLANLKSEGQFDPKKCVRSLSLKTPSKNSTTPNSNSNGAAAQPKKMPKRNLDRMVQDVFANNEWGFKVTEKVSAQEAKRRKLARRLELHNSITSESERGGGGDADVDNGPSAVDDGDDGMISPIEMDFSDEDEEEVLPPSNRPLVITQSADWKDHRNCTLTFSMCSFYQGG